MPDMSVRSFSRTHLTFSRRRLDSALTNLAIASSNMIAFIVRAESSPFASDQPTGSSSLSSQGCFSARKATSDATQRHLPVRRRSEEHTYELQSLLRISYAVFGLQK